MARPQSVLTPEAFCAVSIDGVLVEYYRYAPGPAPGIPVHTHDDYQFGLPETLPGLYRYRGAAVPVPVRCVSLLHPGEAHGSLPREPHTTTAIYRMLYIPRGLMASLAREMRLACEEPWFADAVMRDTSIVRSFAALHRAAGDSPFRVQCLLRDFVAMLAERQGFAIPRVPSEPRRVIRAREYIHDRVRQPISLTEIADAVGLSPFHLARCFRRAFGVPPHQYQTTLRVERAKRLLLTGVTIDRVARDVGFFDQSHLNRHFRRIVGVTPGRYAADSDTDVFHAATAQQERPSRRAINAEH
jgi:AraC-like DNA-binding protein